jgi:hypothetical protein
MVLKERSNLMDEAIRQPVTTTNHDLRPKNQNEK